MRDTTIAQDALNRGGVLVGDKYHVLLETMQRLTKIENIVNDHRILEVLEFRPAPRQGILPLFGNST